MLRIIQLFLILGILSCGGAEDDFTWGDVAEALSSAYCNRVYGPDCYDLAQYTEYCIQHSMFHLCATSDCEQELSQEAEVATQQCVDAIAIGDCFLLSYYGFLPAECSAIQAFQPSTETAD